MQRVLLLHTGGTLGMKGGRPDTLRPGSFFRTLRERIPELGELADVELELFSNVDSCEVQPELWAPLAQRLFTRLPDFDGAVVTHGTDTLAETASALSFMLPNLAKPVVLTGAQRPLGEVRSDARLNLIDAVICALAGPPEVTVCFDSHLYRGNRVRKVSTAEYDAFDSPNSPPLGVLGVETRFRPAPRRTRPARLELGLDPRVFLLRVFPGLDPAIAMGVVERVHGLVLEAYGVGNFPISGPRSLRPLLQRAQELQVPVVVVSQAQRNGVDLSLYPSGALALEHGAISGADMTPSAAVVKLMHALALCAGRGRRALERYLTRCVAGELTSFEARSGKKS